MSTEFIFFQTKPSVKPEDPSSDEGELLLRHFRTVKHESGYLGSAWGRAIEDEKIIVWVVEWKDAHGGTQPQYLAPFVEPNSHVTILYSTLFPSIYKDETLAQNPVTEVTALAFPSDLSREEQHQLHHNLIHLRTTLMEDFPVELRPTTWRMGQVERPGTVPYEKSPSGKAVIHILAVGWENIETHLEVRGLDEFKAAIGPVAEKMLPYMPGLEVKHVRFRDV